MAAYFEYQENSIIVLPGKVFDIANVYGCNLACPYCQSSQFLEKKKSELDIDALFDRISLRAKYIDGILFTGGEPTSFPELLDLFEKIHTTLHLKIVIETNGLEPDFIEKAAPYLHSVKIDVKSTPDYYDTLQSPYSAKEVDQRLLRVKKIAEDSDFFSEYHTTMYPPLIESYEILYKIASYIPLSSSWYLHQLNVQKHLDTAPFSYSKLEQMMKELRIDLSREAIYLRTFAL